MRWGHDTKWAATKTGWVCVCRVPGPGQALSRHWLRPCLRFPCHRCLPQPRDSRLWCSRSLTRLQPHSRRPSLASGPSLPPPDISALALSSDSARLKMQLPLPGLSMVGRVLELSGSPGILLSLGHQPDKVGSAWGLGSLGPGSWQKARLQGGSRSPVQGHWHARRFASVAGREGLLISPE